MTTPTNLTVPPNPFLRTLGVRQGDAVSRVYFVYAAAVVSLAAILASLFFFKISIASVALGVSIASISFLVNRFFPWDHREITLPQPTLPNAQLPLERAQPSQPQSRFSSLRPKCSVAVLSARGFPVGTKDLATHFKLPALYTYLESLVQHHRTKMAPEEMLAAFPEKINAKFNKGNNQERNLPILRKFVRHYLTLCGYKLPEKKVAVR